MQRTSGSLAIAAILLAASFVFSLAATSFAADARPNLIIIMADDMGYSDIGCYGGEIETPTLDGLADSGLRFTQFYNTARCCPTRACLISGLYSHQAGVGHMTGDRGFDGFRGDLNSSCVTIAEVMKSAGYSTYMSGKWHVTRFWRQEDSKHSWPIQRGFDRYFGTIQGAGSFFDPYTLTRGNDPIVPDSDDFYYTDAIADTAATFVREHDRSRPFFMYVPFTSPHWPMHAKPADVAKYKGRYDDGWDTLRASRHRRMIEMGIVKADWPITPRDPNAPAWEDAQRKPWHCRRMEVYAAMIDCMDQGIGRIVESLKETDQYENTLIMFVADNGGCAEEYGSRGPEKPDPSKPNELKPMEPGEHQTRMQPSHTRDGRPLRTGLGVMPGPADTYIAYGLPWANASNTPFRLYKHWVHEGGISTPLVCHWPAGIPQSRHGELYHEPGHLIDLMATCVDVGKATYPEEFKGKAITPMQGVSLRPSFTDQSLNRPKPIFWEHEGNRAVRQGKWKLVARGAAGPWELYDLEADRTELVNLADTQPERAEAMAECWEAWAIEAKAKPWPYGPKPKQTNSARKPGGGPRFSQVSGVVTLDGQPLAGASVQFVPVDGQPASGTTDRNGRYELFHAIGKKGAAAGQYKVRIIPPSRDGQGADLPESERIGLPARYNEESEISFEVEPGSNTFEIHIELAE